MSFHGGWVNQDASPKNLETFENITEVEVALHSLYFDFIMLK